MWNCNIRDLIMNILAVSKHQLKGEDNEGGSETSDGIENAKTGSRYPTPHEKATRKDNSGDRMSQVGDESRPSNNRIAGNPTIDEFEHCNENIEITPGHDNLIDLLCNGGCISLLQKQHIEQQPTQQLQNLEMLHLLQNGSIETFNVALVYFRLTNQDTVVDLLSRKYLSEDIQSSEWIVTRDVNGVAWLEDEIYIVCSQSNIVHIFPDKETNASSQVECLELEGMSDPYDMAASKPSRSIFISDSLTQYLWKIHMPGREIFKWPIDGRPGCISVSSTGVLIVCVYRYGRFYLNLYRSSDVTLIESLPLPTELKKLNHAIQLLNGNFVIAYSLMNDPDSFLISELSDNGTNFIQEINPRSTKSSPMYYWIPCHLSIDEDENIFIADHENDRIILVNSRLTDVHILLNRDQHSIKLPWRLCYVSEKQQLIVRQGKSDRPASGVCIFNICQHISGHRTRERELIKSCSLDLLNANGIDTLNPVQYQPDITFIKHFEVETTVVGVAWLENKIYVIGAASNTVRVFSDEPPFVELRRAISIQLQA